MEETVFQNSLVYVTIENNVGILHINNGKQNRISNPEFIEIKQLNELISKYKMKALVICGEGKNFSVGADVDQFKEYKNQSNEFKESLNTGKDLLSYIEKLPILTVALINGACFGAGFEIALSCQFRFAGEKALFAFPEVNLGLMPGMGGTVRLTKLVGKSKALEMILGGEMISAERAAEVGIIDKIVPKKLELDNTLNWINEMTKDKSEKQLLKIINAVNNAISCSPELSYSLETESFVDLMNDAIIS